MLTLPHQVEFGTEAWLDAARRFLAREVEMRHSLLDGCTFSASERFTDAPPHLKFDGNVCAWTIRYDGAQVTVTRGFDPDADSTIEGDYQQALVGAQFVGVLVPGGAQDMQHEITHLFGRNAFRAQIGRAHV